MGQTIITFTDEAASYHASTNEHTTMFHTAPCASYASPIPTPVPYITIQYEPVARRTRSISPQTVDHPPPRVNKTPDTAPIYRRTSSQTAAMASVTTPSQAAQRLYPAQFLQSLEMPVLDEISGQLLQYRQLRKHPEFAHILNTSYANELGRICQ